MDMETTAGLFMQDGLLIRELNHRINNEFASAAGMVSLAAARADDRAARSALNNIMERLEDYAHVHRALRMPDPEAPAEVLNYLFELCRSISRSRLESRNIVLTLAGSPVMLDAQRCWLLGLIVYELVNNAARHAFRGSGGRIRTEIDRMGDYVACRVSDSGSGVSPVAKEGGLKIVRELAARLDGIFEIRPGVMGLEATVVFPVQAPSEEGT